MSEYFKMAAAVTRHSVLSLYRQLLRQGEQFVSFNYRMYAKRRIRDYFKGKKGLEDASKIAREFQHGLESLEMLQRQTSIGRMYQTNKLIIEDGLAYKKS